MAKQRIDHLVVTRGLAESREKARALVLAGEVLVNGHPAAKPGQMVDDSAPLSVIQPPRYVGRGGDKLEHALRVFGLNVTGSIALDAGASTGGFTDCLLQHGARRVYAVDVGYGVMHQRIRSDPRVVVVERTNIRYLETLPGAATPSVPTNVTLATLDLSFISLTKVLLPVGRLLLPGSPVVTLVKPQFEAEQREVGRGGIVRDAAVHARVLGRLAAWCTDHHFRVRGLTTSPIRGGDGNREFLMLLRTPLADG